MEKPEAHPGYTSTFIRGFILVAFQAPGANRVGLEAHWATGIKPRMNVLVNPGSEGRLIREADPAISCTHQTPFESA
jgi:hypothetical protein